MKDPCDCRGCVMSRQLAQQNMAAAQGQLNQRMVQDVFGTTCSRSARPDVQKSTAAAAAIEPAPSSPLKAPLDRLGEIPRAMNALARQIAHGGDKYAVGDWRKQTREYFLAKILRHAIAAASGEILDEEGRPHLVAVMTNAAMATELEGKS